MGPPWIHMGYEVGMLGNICNDALSVILLDNMTKHLKGTTGLDNMTKHLKTTERRV